MSMWDAVAGLRFMETVPERLGEISESLKVIAKNTENIGHCTCRDAANPPESVRNMRFASADDELLSRALEYAIETESDDNALSGAFSAQIMHQTWTDEESSDVQLINDYINAGPEGRAAMDRLLINLCGWPMKTIIELVLEPENTAR